MKAEKREKTRLDALLVDRGFFPSAEEARRALMAGSVRVGDRPAPKPGDRVDADVAITVAGRDRYVSRGGLKLEAGLSHFHVDPTGKVCLDVGASTGGFTDCLLQHGALRVHSIDVGTNQLDWRIRSDPRVAARENLNARHLTERDLGEKVEVLVADVSFISLTLVLPPARALLIPGGVAVVLIKPQFEVDRAHVAPGGIVTDPVVRLQAVENIRQFVTDVLGCAWLGSISSPLRGLRSGNEEFLAAFVTPGGPPVHPPIP